MTVQETLENALSAVRSQFDAEAPTAADIMRWLETANELYSLIAIVKIAKEEADPGTGSQGVQS